jgi:hypothetical protein
MNGWLPHTRSQCNKKRVAPAAIKYVPEHSARINIMFVGAKYAYKSAEVYCVKQQAVKAKRDRWSSGSKSSDRRKIIREGVPIRSGLTRMSEPNKKLESEAIAMVQDRIRIQAKRKSQDSLLTKLVAQMASAGMESSNNQKGLYSLLIYLRKGLSTCQLLLVPLVHIRIFTQFSHPPLPLPFSGAFVRKIKNFEAELNQITANLDALDVVEKLFLDISSEDVELDGHGCDGLDSATLDRIQELAQGKMGQGSTKTPVASIHWHSKNSRSGNDNSIDSGSAHSRSKHSRSGNGNSIDSASAHSRSKHSRSGNDNSIDSASTHSRSKHSRSGNGNSLDSASTQSRSKHSRSGNDNSLDVSTNSIPWWEHGAI